jgi:hypothetical protein
VQVQVQGLLHGRAATSTGRARPIWMDSALSESALFSLRIWLDGHFAYLVGLFAQRYRVDQPRTQTEGQGNSGHGLHHKQVQVDLGWWEGGSWPTALPPSPARSVYPARGAYKTSENTARPGGLA